MSESLPHGLRRARPIHGARALDGRRVPLAVGVLEQPAGRRHLVLLVDDGDPVLLPRSVAGRFLVALHMTLDVDLGGGGESIG